jgi:hypothetical protein
MTLQEDFRDTYFSYQSRVTFLIDSRAIHINFIFISQRRSFLYQMEQINIPKGTCETLTMCDSLLIIRKAHESLSIIKSSRSTKC